MGEQVRQDREQETVGPRQEEPVDRRRRSRQEGPRHQGLLRHQEGVALVRQGQGTLQEVNTAACLPGAQLELRRHIRFDSWSCTVEELAGVINMYLPQAEC